VGKIIEQIRQEDIVLLQLEIPVPVVEYAIKNCRKKGARVILNPAPAHLLSDETLSFVDIITPNETEAELLTGVKITDLKSAATAANILLDKGVMHVVITLGAKGAYIHDRDLQKIIASPVVDAVDTTAAGDIFNGALAVALTEADDLESAVGFACRAASVSVTRMGAQSSAPRRSELND
jgi:ribokinase